jgi:hypothetical protein
LCTVAVAVTASICAGARADTGTSTAPLTFGTFPGVVPPTAPTAALADEVAALERLKKTGSPFVVHLYTGYAGPLPWREYEPGPAIRYFAKRGFESEVVLRYTPFNDGGSPRDVRAFVRLVSRVVRTFGGDPAFVSVQITNEADCTGNAASDGYFKYAEDALIQGVIAAKAEARAHHFDQLKVGFNYCGAGGPPFWRYLRRHGGLTFDRAVDWVGIDTYPGSWFPLPPGPLAQATHTAIVRAILRARNRVLPQAGIPSTAALHFSETGYSTDGGRTFRMQAIALRAAVRTVAALDVADRITEYIWFDLYDGDSSSLLVPSRFGLLQSDFQRKPAFAIYRRLVRRYG